MGLGFGYNAWLGVGSESTYGTPLARLQFLEVNSAGLMASDDVLTSNSVYNSAVDVDNIRQGRKVVGGNFEVDLRRTGWELFMKTAMGTVAFDTLGAGGTCIERTYTIPDTIGTSLCLELNRDSASFLYDGVKVNSFTLNGDSEGILKLSADVIAEDEGTVSASTPTFSTSQYYMFHEGVISYAGTSRNVTNWSVTVNQNLTTDRYFHGSRFTADPQRAGKMEVTGEFTVEFEGTTDWNSFSTAGTGALSFTYSGGTLDGTVLEKFQVSLPKTRLAGSVPDVSDSGRIIHTIPFVSYADGTTKPITIVAVNSLASTGGY